MSASLDNEDYPLDVPFCADGVNAVLRKLESGKAASHDLLQADHLKYGGPALRKWIEQICNAIIDLECVPDSQNRYYHSCIQGGMQRPPRH